MTEDQYLLSQISQEASELAVEASKCQMFGMDTVYEDPVYNPERLSNVKRLERELQDLLASVQALSRSRTLSGKREIKTYIDKDYMYRKFAKIDVFMRSSQSLGETTPKEK